ncbi:MAG: MFS transporter [Candidatus Velthaea sp.]
MQLTLTPVRTALRNRSFAGYLAVSCLADCGFWIAIVAQGWLVIKLTNSPLWLGLVAGASQAPALFVSLLGGVLADRFDRRAVILWCEGAIGAIAAVTALTIAAGHITVLLIAVLAFAAGAMMALEHPVDRAFIYDLIDGDDVEQSVALSSVEFSIARTAGPALGGIAIATVGIAAGYALQAVCVVPIVVFAVLALKRGFGTHGARAKSKSKAASDGTPASLGDAVAYFRKERTIVLFCILTAAFTIGISPYVALLADIARNTLHLDERGYGALQAAAGVGALAGALSLSLSNETEHKGRVIAGTVFAGGTLLAIFTTLRQPWLAGAALFAMGAVDSLMYALANTYIQERTEERFRGRANAIFTVAFLGGIPVGNVVLGALASRIGAEWTLFGSALAVAACAVAFWFVAAEAREAG